MLLPFFIRHNKELKKIQPENVILLVTEENYTRIFLSDRSNYMVRTSLAGALKKLPPEMFIRIHRTYVVSVFFIDSINRDHLLIGDQPVPIGKLYYRSLVKRLNIIE